MVLLIFLRRTSSTSSTIVMAGSQSYVDVMECFKLAFSSCRVRVDGVGVQGGGEVTKSEHPG